MWMADHRRDIESDFSVFHHIRNPEETLDGPEYFELAERLPYYAGAIQGIHLAKHAEEKGVLDKANNAPRPAHASSKPAGVRTIPSTRGALAGNSATSDLFEFE